MFADMPIQHNSELYPPSQGEGTVPWGSPPAFITALDAQDLAFLAWARNVTLDELEERTS